jgi:hypothetical protein
MKLTIFLAAIAVVPVSAQLAPMKPAPAANIAAKPAATIGTTETSLVSLQSLRTLEQEMDGRISATGDKTDPCTVLGQTRGLYIRGLGAVFSAEVELAVTPGQVGLFQTAVGPDQKARIRKDKLAHVPLLEKTLSDMVLSLAASPVLKLSDSDQVVVAARLVYRSWEDTTGMPGQIVAHLDRRSGAIKVEVQ